MISISTTTPKTVSNIVFEERKSSKLSSFPTRSSRTSYLDGSCYINWTQSENDSDRTLTIRGNLTKEISDNLQSIYELNELVYLSCSEGFFSGAIGNFSINNGVLNMSFLVKEKIS